VPDFDETGYTDCKTPAELKKHESGITRPVITMAAAILQIK
jgi:hypothetical protein